jgi:hypothetical protein
MSLHVIGAGVGRTGTRSLKAALEHLLGAPCYHMDELLTHPEHVQVWDRALDHQSVDWNDIFSEYAATVDWPGAAFWPELAYRYPDALVILSEREVSEWWESARETFVELMVHEQPSDFLARKRSETALGVITSRFCAELADPEAMCAAYQKHSQSVRDTIAPSRLLVWAPNDGWRPLAEALHLPEPTVVFPHLNTREYFRERFGLPPIFTQ